MQLDIFDHSRDIMLRNDTLDALQRHDATTARTAWRRFADEFPLDRSLPALKDLVEALEQRSGDAFNEHAALGDACRRLDERIVPAALALFGETDGRSWLAARWRELAQRSTALPFRADRSDDHAAPLWLRAGDWSAAADATARVESWRRIPAPLGWMAEARCRLDGVDLAWPLLVELAWLSPARFDAVMRRVGDPLLEKLRKQFDASFEGDGGVDDLAWFPAWLLTENPGLASRLAEAQPSRDTPAERAMRLLVQLLVLERQGRHHDLVERRKALRDLHPFLYGEYLKTR